MTRFSLLIVLLLLGNLAWGQRLTKFKFSDCLQNCDSDSSKIHEITKAGVITTIRLRTYAPCGGNLEGGFKIAKDTLNLEFWTKPTKTWKDKQGRMVSIVSISDCNCIFDFTYQITGIKVVTEKKIKVNGMTLLEIDKENIWEIGNID